MNHTVTPERLFTKPDNLMMKRMPLGVISYADNKYEYIFPIQYSLLRKPTIGQAEPGILCKKIDNTTNFVDLSQPVVGNFAY